MATRFASTLFAAFIFTTSAWALGDGVAGVCTKALDPVVQLLTELSQPRPVFGSGHDSPGVTQVLRSLLPTGMLRVHKLPEPLNEDSLFGGGYVPELPLLVDQLKFEHAPHAQALKIDWFAHGKVTRTITVHDHEGKTPVSLTVHKIPKGYLVIVHVQHEVRVSRLMRTTGLRSYELKFDFSDQGHLTEADIYTTDVSGTHYPDYTRRISRLQISPASR